MQSLISSIKLVSKSPPLMAELRTLHKFLHALEIQIQAIYLPSAVNRFADRLFRLKTLDGWKINRAAIQPLLSRFKPTVDRFADPTSHICPRFNSEFHALGSESMDALSQFWGINRNFWNPQLELLPLVVEMISHERATGILVTPCWPA